MRESIVERIVRKTKIDTGKNLSSLDISEKKVLDEYRNLWLDSVKRKDKVNMLYNHPNLLMSDYKLIEEKVAEYRTKKYLHAVYSTVALIGVYNVAFKNRWYFYNFFNKKSWSRFAFARKFKKFALLYGTYIGNV